ncbi:MAG: hypothetical protein ACOYZ7_10520 [Chloroflexota bacterium]
MTATKIWEHALLGSRWLVEHQNPDGSWKGLDAPKADAFYKGGWPLLLTGQPAAAHRLLNYAKQHFLTAEGDFIPRGHPWHTSVHYVYANVYFIVASVLAGRYELATPALRFLQSMQDSEHGGFYSRRPAEGQRELCDTMSAGAAGVALLAAGQTDAARRVADFLARIVELQPTPDERFFTTVEADGRLGAVMQNDDESRWRIIETRLSNQCWYAVGLPLAFLVRFAQATGEARYRDLAQWYFDFQTRCVDPWDGGSSGKAGWACAMLYRITGETRYRDIAFHIANNIMGKQGDDGSWASFVGGGYSEGGKQTLTDSAFDVTSEFTLWLALIAANVLARDAA